MSRTSHAARFGAIAFAAVALAVSSASPALAFGPADISIYPGTTGENPLTTVAVICPATSTTFSSTWTGTQNGSPNVLSVGATSLDVNGEWEDTYYLESFFDRDSDVTFALDCFDAGLASTGSDSTLYRLPTTGAASSAPASRAANAALVVTGDCGTAASITSLTVYAYQQPGAVLLAGFPQTVPYTNAADYSLDLGTPTSLGLVSGDTTLVQVLCNSSAPSAHTTSVRGTTTVITAAVVAAAAPALAATGSDPTGSLLSAGALVLAGGALAFSRRRKTA